LEVEKIVRLVEIERCVLFHDRESAARGSARQLPPEVSDGSDGNCYRIVVRNKTNLFPALIKHWRNLRGMSQLDLALTADVSSRHVSFLETGRAQPSREMILRLATALSVPMRDQNALLAAAGFGEAYAEPGPEALSGPVFECLEHMLSHHEPYPMVVMNRVYDVLRTNNAATALLPRVVAEPAALAPPINAFRLLFDERLARPFVVDWAQTARALIARLHREVLERANDTALADLLRALFEYPDVPRDWQQPNLAAPSEPCLAIRLRRPGLELAFLTTITVFSAPQNVTVDELRIESYFPLDEATRRACAAL
jgi:transcriptional regulator with XRE-family HTH domain